MTHGPHGQAAQHAGPLPTEIAAEESRFERLTRRFFGVVTC